jgi:hypothetical protein
LHEQLLSLPDETRVFPADGAGSAWVKSLSDAVSSTIGEQRRWNSALQPMSQAAFVEVVTQPVGGAAVIRLHGRQQPSSA